MRTRGLVHRIGANGSLDTSIVDADSTQPVLEVLRAVFGSELSIKDLLEGNTLPQSPDLHTTEWRSWQMLNPVTLIGARFLHRGHGAAPVSVLAGPDSGYTIDIDSREALLSRLSRSLSLTVLDPCIPRQPTPLSLDATGEQDSLSLGATIFAPQPRAGRTHSAPLNAPLVRAPPQRHDEVHVAPDRVDDPRPVRPPQWWTFLIPVGIGVVLAVLTGMWWFLLFSVSAPLSGYVAHIMEKRRFTRETQQCGLDRQAALTRARVRLSELMAAAREDVFSRGGLCLGFGAVLSEITVDEQLREEVDCWDSRVILNQVPVRIDPLTTAVTVTGEVRELRNMALAWMAEPVFDWLPSGHLRDLPELVGTGVDARSEPSVGTAAHGSSPSAQIRIRLDETSTPASLHLEPPAAAATISLVLGSLAQAHILSSTAPDGPVPRRPLVATLMPPARFVTLSAHRGPRSGSRPWPSHGLADLCDDDPAVILRRWNAGSNGPVPIGRGTSGDVSIDLFEDGPHALVAGTTGSGKSLLLQTWLLSMALSQPPELLRLVLIDFKGAATFAPLEGLPHTDSVLDDFDSALAFRALVSVRAEITRRERLLAERGCADVLDLADPPPRLVVVIDEFHALMATHPQAADLLEHLTALGRSLGVHLILATQRPLGVVTGQMKANINIRVCLRVRDETDSFDVIGCEAAAHLPPDQPGAACLDSGASVSQFRVAVPLADESAAEALRRPRLRPWVPGQDVTGTDEPHGIDVDNIIAAADREPAAESPRPIVLPPLPTVDDLLADVSLAEATADSDGMDAGAMPERPGLPAPVTGIIDLPNHQRQTRWKYSPAVDGSVIMLGAETETSESVLARMAGAAAETRRIVALGRIAARLDSAEIRCGMGSGWRLQTILDHLGPDSGSPDRPPSVVVCSNWAEFNDALDHHWADQLDRLLKHGAAAGLTFLLAGCRSAIGASARFSTRIVFPPTAGEDGLSVGLSRQRFAGNWPDHRAVLLGPAAQDAGPDGADVQLVPADLGTEPTGSRSETRERTDHTERRFEPRWHGLERPAPRPLLAQKLAANLTAANPPEPASIPLGVDAFGEPVLWDPARDGSVLTVRGSPQSGKTEFAALLEHLNALSTDSTAVSRSANPTISIHDDAHLESDPTAIDLFDSGMHVITLPLRFAPGYGSPLSKAQELGPLLVLGSHSRHDLANLGLLKLAPLDGQPGTAWFVTELRSRAVRLFRADAVRDDAARDDAAPANTAPTVTTRAKAVQETSAGGPVRVS